jgi:Mg2+/citrate symporter
VWTTTNTGDGDFYADDGFTTPDNGEPTVGPYAGAWYAVSDEFDPGRHALTQTITLPTNIATLNFSAQMFVNDQSGSAGFGELAVWAAGVNTATTAPILYVGRTDTPVTGGAPNPYVATGSSLLSDLGSLLIEGDTYQFGVLEVDSTGIVNVGVDNMNLAYTLNSTTPEPGMLFPTAILAAGMLIFRARRKARAQV